MAVGQKHKSRLWQGSVRCSLVVRGSYERIGDSCMGSVPRRLIRKRKNEPRQDKQPPHCLSSAGL